VLRRSCLLLEARPLMGLVKCSECGVEVSDKAAACPKCGAPVGGVRPPAPRVKRSGVRAFTLILLVGLAAAAYLFLRSSGKTVTSAVSGPETLVSETVVLKEGQAKDYSFTLPSSRRVEVSVSASPKNVSVYLMDGNDFAGYQEARATGRGQFTFKRPLSAEKAVRVNQADVLPEGKWHFVVERPNESLLFGDDTSATVKLVAF
jgi:hypothetical protein